MSKDNRAQVVQAATEYLKANWQLIPIPERSKGPIHAGWNRKVNTLTNVFQIPHNGNVGLAHAYTGTMALDVDLWDEAARDLAEQGIDLQALYDAPDAVTIESGRDGHGKLLYRMPFGIALPSKKLIMTAEDGTRVNYLDFRCGTSSGLTVQDVLPPSIHPVTNAPYRWGGKGDWRQLPEIPFDLLQYWRALLEKDSERTIPSADMNASWDEIKEALYRIPAGISRDQWIEIGMALHWAGNQTDQLEQAFILWDEWSQGSDKYKGWEDLWASWPGFDDSKGITVGTLFGHAKLYGWKRAMPTAEGMFQAVKNQLINSHEELFHYLEPEAPDLDMNLFPEVLRQRAHELSVSKGCDPLIPLWAGVAVVSAACDARSRLVLTDDFKVPPVIWILTVGRPGDKKTPGADPMKEVLHELEIEDRPRHHKRLLQWEAEKLMADRAHKEFLERKADPLSVENDVETEVPMVSNAPVPKRFIVGDITSQALVEKCLDRPEGMICWMDESHGWVEKLTNPRSGDDRSTWVQSFEAGHLSVDRVGKGSLLNPCFAVSIYGNLQPQPLREHVAKMGTDGLLQRFIMVPLRSSKSVMNEPINKMFTNTGQWNQLIRRIHALPKTDFTVSPDAYKVFRDFQKWYQDEKALEDLIGQPDIYMGSFGKLEGMTGRMALLLHLMTEPENTVVSADTMSRACTLTKEYLLKSLRFILGVEAGLIENTFDFWLANYIVQVSGELDMIRMRDLKHSARRQLAKYPPYQRNQVILDSMAMLEEYKYVAVLPDGAPAEQSTWVINPNLKESMAERRKKIIQIKQSRLDDTRKRVFASTGKMIERRTVRGWEPSMDQQ